MYAMLMFLGACLFIGTVTVVSYKLGERKTENPKMAALTGFLLAFLPPLALIYLAVLVFKEDVSVV